MMADYCELAVCRGGSAFRPYAGDEAAAGTSISPVLRLQADAAPGHTGAGARWARAQGPLVAPQGFVSTHTFVSEWDKGLMHKCFSTDSLTLRNRIEGFYAPRVRLPITEAAAPIGFTISVWSGLSGRIWNPAESVRRLTGQAV